QPTDGKAGILRRPESQEACPGTSTQRFDGKSLEAGLDLIGASSLPASFEVLEGFFFFPCLSDSSAAPRRTNGGRSPMENLEGKKQKAESRSQKLEIRRQKQEVRSKNPEDGTTHFTRSIRSLYGRPHRIGSLFLSILCIFVLTASSQAATIEGTVLDP